ncbi:MAG: hypothetical protein IPK89_13495 [Sphingomonadales bacterium]|nr:hypothetical protein [Sphingomonadales bacterium]
MPGPVPTSAVDPVGFPDPAPAARGADTKQRDPSPTKLRLHALRRSGQDLTALAAVQVLAVA